MKQPENEVEEIKRGKSNQLGVWVREVGVNLLSQIAKMADGLLGDRVVLPVTAALNRNGKEESAMRWSFEMGIGERK